MLTVDARGVFPIAPTPFMPDGRLDERSLDRLMDYYVAAGADGCTILGIMGEAPKLDAEEALSFATRCIRRAEKLPITSASRPRALQRCGHWRALSMELGAAGVMIAPPSSLRADDQIVGYYAQAAEAIGADIPFVIQDYPLSLTVEMTPE